MTKFLDTMGKIRRLEKRLQEQLASMQWFCENGSIYEVYLHSLNLEETAERLVLLTRVLPAYTGVPNAKLEVERRIKDCIPVEIGFTAEDWFCLRIPALLPKKAGGSADYVRSFLYPAMRAFFEKQPPVRYRDCILIYRHVYDKARPERKRRDHDNIEINMVSDIVAMYVMTDDGPSVCSHYYCSAEGPADRTEVYVVPKWDFPIWLVKETRMPDEGVPLYEKRKI